MRNAGTLCWGKKRRPKPTSSPSPHAPFDLPLSLATCSPYLTNSIQGDHLRFKRCCNRWYLGEVARQPGSSRTGRLDALDLAQPRRVGEYGEQVLPFQVLVVGQDLIVRHTGAHQLQKRLDRIPKTSDYRLAVTDLRIYSYAFEKVIHLHTPLAPPAQVRTERLAFQRSVLPTALLRQAPLATTRPRRLARRRVAGKRRRKPF